MQPRHIFARAAKSFVCEHAVLCVAFVAAAASMIAVPPDAQYLNYLDFKTLACLFSILAIAAALQNAGALSAVARIAACRFSRCRSAVATLVGTTLALSMFITNDMALVVMLPISAAVLAKSDWESAIPFALIMQNLTANLGGMILPFGNPQNLYLYEHFNIAFTDFFYAMLPSFSVACLLIALCCGAHRFSGNAGARAPKAEAARVKSASSGATIGHTESVEMPRVAVCLALLALVVAAVFRVVPWQVALIVVAAALAAIDRSAIKSIDIGLLLTFVCFFVFSGNIARVPALGELLALGMQNNPLALSAGLSQVISNVPSAILLSNTTDVWQPLLIGVNIGGAGTPVASLASLITISQYRAVTRQVGAAAPLAGRTGTAASTTRQFGMAGPATGQVGMAKERACMSEKLPSQAKFIALLTLYGFAFLILLASASLSLPVV